MQPRVAILTVSDRSSSGQRADLSGPALQKLVQDYGWQLVESDIVPDEQEQIQTRLVSWADTGKVDLILTTGGTGFTRRDVTPEATLAVCQRMAPGLAEVMRASSLQVTPHGMLSRAVAGIRATTLIVNLPGSPKAAGENLAAIAAVIPHAVQMLQDDPDTESSH